MAIEIAIPKDVTKYESKLVGPLTTRQTVCFVPAAATAIAIWLGLGKDVSQDLKIGLILIAVVPFLLFGWFKPYGIPLEKFLKNAFISNILSPKYRKYVTVNTIIVVDNDEINDENDKNVNSIKKKTQNVNKNKTKNKKSSTPSKNYVAYK